MLIFDFFPFYYKIQFYRYFFEKYITHLKNSQNNIIIIINKGGGETNGGIFGAYKKF